MTIGTILVCSVCTSAGYWLGGKNILYAVLLFLISFCVLFTGSVAVTFGVDLLNILLQPQSV